MGLTKNQKKALEFIRKNPGVTANQLAKVIYGAGSKATVPAKKIIEVLEREQLIESVTKYIEIKTYEVIRY